MWGGIVRRFWSHRVTVKEKLQLFAIGLIVTFLLTIIVHLTHSPTAAERALVAETLANLPVAYLGLPSLPLSLAAYLLGIAVTATGMWRHQSLQDRLSTVIVLGAFAYPVLYALLTLIDASVTQLILAAERSGGVQALTTLVRLVSALIILNNGIWTAILFSPLIVLNAVLFRIVHATFVGQAYLFAPLLLPAIGGWIQLLLLP
jgi:hypothetical protein